MCGICNKLGLDPGSIHAVDSRSELSAVAATSSSALPFLLEDYAGLAT